MKQSSFINKIGEYIEASSNSKKCFLFLKSQCGSILMLEIPIPSYIESSGILSNSSLAK